MSRLRVPIIAIALVAAALIAVFAVSQVPSDAAGMGIPTENLVEQPAAAAQPLSGEMREAGNGCFHLQDGATSYLVVWPKGFTHNGASSAVAPDGTRYGDGDALEGAGWIRTVDEVVAAADGQDGYMDMVTGYCADEGEQVAVFVSLD